MGYLLFIIRFSKIGTIEEAVLQRQNKLDDTAHSLYLLFNQTTTRCENFYLLSYL